MSGLAGTWSTVVNSPMGVQKGTLTLVVDGATLTGSIEGAQGTLQLRDGVANGNEGSWKADLTSPMPLTLEFTVKSEGDELSGNVKLGAFGNASITGTRQT